MAFDPLTSVLFSPEDNVALAGIDPKVLTGALSFNPDTIWGFISEEVIDKLRVVDENAIGIRIYQLKPDDSHSMIVVAVNSEGGEIDSEEPDKGYFLATIIGQMSCMHTNISRNAAGVHAANSTDEVFGYTGYSSFFSWEELGNLSFDKGLFFFLLPKMESDLKLHIAVPGTLDTETNKMIPIPNSSFLLTSNTCPPLCIDSTVFNVNAFVPVFNEAASAKYLLNWQEPTA